MVFFALDHTGITNSGRPCNYVLHPEEALCRHHTQQLSAAEWDAIVAAQMADLEAAELQRARAAERTASGNHRVTRTS